MDQESVDDAPVSQLEDLPDDEELGDSRRRVAFRTGG